MGERLFLQLNPEIAARFLPVSQRGVVRSANFQVLPAAKPAGVRRIFCLGESSTAGFPLPAHGAFPALLQELLTHREPDSQWEVTNLGVTALSSSSIADLIDEALALKPDALVCYFGHNEFYGAGGVATPGAFGTLATLRKLRLVRAVETILQSFGVGSEEEEETLEDTRVRAKVPPRSPDREKAYKHFEANLSRILDRADRAGVRVVLCEVVSNERDFFPFGSSGALGDELGGIGMAVVDWVDGRPTPDQARSRLAELDAEAARDSLHAGILYLRGACRAALGISGAWEDFARARDLDAIPFRAPDRINAIIREVGRRRNIRTVPVEEIFRAETADGSLGSESFVEHLHLTFRGAARLASAIADELSDRPFERLSDADAARLLLDAGITPLDAAYADARMELLLTRWPFRRTGGDAAPFPYHARSLRQEAAELLAASGDTLEARKYLYLSGEVQEQVAALQQKRTDLLKAHLHVARVRMDSGDLRSAARELDAATRLFPVDATLWLQAAELHQIAGNRMRAARSAENALLWDPSNERARAVLGLR